MIRAHMVRPGLVVGFSFLFHLLVLLVLVEMVGLNPALSSVLSFCIVAAVFLFIQPRRMFRCPSGFPVALPHFLLAAPVGLMLNATIMVMGTGVFHSHYLIVQILAFVAILISNYSLNRLRLLSATPDSAESNPALPMPWRHAATLTLFILATISIAPFAAVLLDFARDLSISADIVEYGQHQLLGPPLAGLINLGPVWFYLLAGFQAFGLGVFGTVLSVTALATVRFYVAYRIGQLWNDRQTGLIWAALLLLPGWVSLEHFMIIHPALTATFLATSILFGLKHFEIGRMRDLAIMALSFSLAVHAHPSAVVMWTLPVGFAVLAARRHGWRFSAWLLAALVGSLPFIPFVIAMYLQDWPFLDGFSEYSSAQQRTALLATTLRLAWELTGGGLLYWLGTIAGWPPFAAWIAALTFTGMCAAGLAGAFRSAISGDPVTRLFLISLICGLIGLAWLRDVHTFYMLSPTYLVLSGLVSGGLVELSRLKPSITLLRPAVLSFCMFLYAVAALSLVSHQRHGTWPFAWIPLFDVKSSPLEHRPQPFLSALASRDSGHWLCEHSYTTIHGTYALWLLHSYGIEGRLRCGEIRVRLAGPASPNQHVLGLTRSMMSQTDRTPVGQIGSLALVPVRQVLGQPEGFELTAHRAYTPIPPDSRPAISHEWELGQAIGDYLAITHMGFAVSALPRISLACGPHLIEPLAANYSSWLYRIPECGQIPVLTVDTPDLKLVDIVTF
jgi:hypothetical protein